MKKYFTIIIMVGAVLLAGCAHTPYDPANYKPKTSKLANFLFDGAANHPYDYYPNHYYKNSK